MWLAVLWAANFSNVSCRQRPKLHQVWVAAGRLALTAIHARAWWQGDSVCELCLIECISALALLARGNTFPFHIVVWTMGWNSPRIFFSIVPTISFRCNQSQESWSISYLINSSLGQLYYWLKDTCWIVLFTCGEAISDKRRRSTSRFSPPPPPPSSNRQILAILIK